MMLREKLLAQTRCAITPKTIFMFSGINRLRGILTRIQVAPKERKVPLLRHLMALMAQRVCALSLKVKLLIPSLLQFTNPPYGAYGAYGAFRLIPITARSPYFRVPPEEGIPCAPPALRLSTPSPIAREAPSPFVRGCGCSALPLLQTILFREREREREADAD